MFERCRDGSAKNHRLKNMRKLSEPRSFFPVERGTVDLLAKACAHAGIKAIGVKTTV